MWFQIFLIQEIDRSCHILQLLFKLSFNFFLFNCKIVQVSVRALWLIAHQVKDKTSTSRLKNSQNTYNQTFKIYISWDSDSLPMFHEATCHLSLQERKLVKIKLKWIDYGIINAINPKI